jgi:hypothetical protein
MAFEGKVGQVLKQIGEQRPDAEKANKLSFCPVFLPLTSLFYISPFLSRFFYTPRPFLSITSN